MIVAERKNLAEIKSFIQNYKKILIAGCGTCATVCLAGGEGEVKVLFINFGGEDEFYSLSALKSLRKSGIASELYPDAAKMKKQMNYANSRNIPFVVMAGEQERTNGEYTLKDMKTGEQSSISLEALLEKLS